MSFAEEQMERHLGNLAEEKADAMEIEQTANATLIAACEAALDCLEPNTDITDSQTNRAIKQLEAAIALARQ